MGKVREVLGFKVCYWFWSKLKRRIEKAREGVSPRIWHWFLAAIAVLGVLIVLDSWSTAYILLKYAAQNPTISMGEVIMAEGNLIARWFFGQFGIIPGMILARLASFPLVFLIVYYLLYRSFFRMSGDKNKALFWLTLFFTVFNALYLVVPIHHFLIILKI